MSFVTYTRGAAHAQSDLKGGFAHILGKRDGFSKEYMFGRGDEDMLADKVTYTHEVDGDDLELFEDMIDDGRLEKDEFAVTAEAPETPTAKRRIARKAKRAAAAQVPPASGDEADPSSVAGAASVAER